MPDADARFWAKAAKADATDALLDEAAKRLRLPLEKIAEMELVRDGGYESRSVRNRSGYGDANVSGSGWR